MKPHGNLGRDKIRDKILDEKQDKTDKTPDQSNQSTVARQRSEEHATLTF